MFKCEYCGKEYEKKIALVGHMRYCKSKPVEEKVILSEEETDEVSTEKTEPTPIDDRKKSSLKGSDNWGKERRDRWNQWKDQPKNLLHIELKDKTLKPRWVREGDRSNVSRRYQSGWDFAKKEDIANFNQVPLEYGSSLDSRIRVGNMVLMIMPHELVTQRNAHYQDKVKDPSQFGQQTKELIEKIGGNAIDADDSKSMDKFEVDPSVNPKSVFKLT